MVFHACWIGERICPKHIRTVAGGGKMALRLPTPRMVHINASILLSFNSVSFDQLVRMLMKISNRIDF